MNTFNPNIYPKYHFNMLSIQKIIDIFFILFFLYQVTKISVHFIIRSISTWTSHFKHSKASCG